MKEWENNHCDIHITQVPQAELVDKLGIASPKDLQTPQPLFLSKNNPPNCEIVLDDSPFGEDQREDHHVAQFEASIPLASSDSPEKERYEAQPLDEAWEIPPIDIPTSDPHLYAGNDASLGTSPSLSTPSPKTPSPINVQTTITKERPKTLVKTIISKGKENEKKMSKAFAPSVILRENGLLFIFFFCSHFLQ